ncbi:MAG: hypothetical protein R3C97_13325 [Geminicoccaceae bacterium]
MSSGWLIGMFDAVASSLRQRREELDSLDEAIGDGDHGSDLVAGIEAIEAQAAEIEAMTPPDAIRHAGTSSRGRTTGEAVAFSRRCCGHGRKGGQTNGPGLADIASMLEAGVAEPRLGRPRPA